MSGGQDSRTGQQVHAGRDAYVAGRDINNYYGPAEPAVPRLLPRDVPGFTGREGELARLAGLASGGRVVVSAIEGTAGVGKTALAVDAAHQLCTQFPDGQLYADLRGYTEGQEPAEPGEVLEMFLRGLGVLADNMPSTVEAQSGLLRHLLASRRVLVVLDNVRTEVQVRPLLPGTGASLVMVTSRSALPGLEVNERISLDILSLREAVSMLAEVIGADRAAAEAAEVAEVTELCGCLPLALRIAGQLLAAHPVWPVAKLVRMLAGEQDRLTRLGAGDLQVRAAFEVSYQQLDDEDRRLFRLLGLHPGPDFGTAIAAALAGMEPAAAEPMLDRLAEAHLTTEDVPGLFRMHDLLRLFARRTCQETESSADQEAAEFRLVGYYAHLVKFLGDCMEPHLRSAIKSGAEQAGVPAPEMREVLEVSATERRNIMAVLGLAAQRGWHKQVQALSQGIAGPFQVLRYFDDLLTATEIALAVARRTGDTLTEGGLLCNLGIVYMHVWRFEDGIRCLEQAVAVFRESGDRRDESLTLLNLGTVYGQAGRFHDAISCLEQAITIYQETGDQSGASLATYNLGNVSQNLRRFDGAIGCYQRALRIFCEIGDQVSEGHAWDSLGAAYGHLKQYQEAIDCLERALAICQVTGNRHGEGHALGNLGAAYENQGRIQDAVRWVEQAIPIYQETRDRYAEGQSLAHLGHLYQKLRELDKATACWQQAAAAMREVGDHNKEQHYEQAAANVRSRPPREV